MEKIPVTAKVTAYAYPLSIITVMLVFNQSLWFGGIMGQSLIATTRVFSNGIKLSENSNDQKRSLGIVDNDSDWYIPFTVQQYFSVVETRATTI